MTVALLQLYYTSCEQGLSGYAGFQFNAVSRGVGPELMRRVEQLTGYQRPRSVADGEEPVNLCHDYDAANGIVTTAQVVYAGRDPSGRPGNYFAHALATSADGRDMQGIRPAELWASPLWHTTPVGTTELPVLSGRILPGPIDRISAEAFLDTDDEGRTLAARLVTAAVNAINGGRPVVLRGRTAGHNALWLATTSYLLDETMTRRLSFATFTSRADRAGVCVAGTIPGVDSDLVTASLDGSHVVIDTVTHAGLNPVTGSDTVSALGTGFAPHPAASLLAEIGPIRAAGLWATALQLACGSEATLDDWFPVLAAAYILAGKHPAPEITTLSAVAAWLNRRLITPAAALDPLCTDAVVCAVVRHGPELSSTTLRQLGEAAAHCGALDQVDIVEGLLVDRALAALTVGRPAALGDEPFTENGRAAAAGRLPADFGLLSSAAGLDFLEWCKRSAVRPPYEQVRLFVRDVVGPILERIEAGRLPALCTGSSSVSSAVAAGLTDELKRSAPQRVNAVLDGDLGRALATSDPAEHPVLWEMIALRRVETGQLSPAAALERIARLRTSDRPALDDMKLLTRLWPTRAWTVPEARELLPLLNSSLADGPGAPAATYLRPAVRSTPVTDRAVDDWLRLVAAVAASLAFSPLSPDDQEEIHRLAGIAAALDGAKSWSTYRPRDWFTAADQAMSEGGERVPPALWRRLVSIVLEVPEPAHALASGSEELFLDCCREVEHRLRNEPLDVQLAARLFVAGIALHDSQRQHEFLEDLVVPGVAVWPKSALKALRTALAKFDVPRSVVTGSALEVADDGGGILPWPRRRRGAPLVRMFDAAVRYEQQLHADEEDDD